MSDKIKGECGECKWWRKTEEGITIPGGWCFRMPHTEPKGEVEWCGEFEPKEECDHEWVSADNEVVSGAEVCLKCKDIRAKE